MNNVLVERYAYDVFGQPTIRDVNGTEISASALNNPYLFTARRYDAEAGLYYYRARYYDYATGRFLQPDPLGYTDGLNLYAYVGSNPLSWIDPLGLCKDALPPVDRAALNKAAAQAMAAFPPAIRPDGSEDFREYANFVFRNTRTGALYPMQSSTKGIGRKSVSTSIAFRNAGREIGDIPGDDEYVIVAYVHRHALEEGMFVGINERTNTFERAGNPNLFSHNDQLYSQASHAGPDVIIDVYLENRQGEMYYYNAAEHGSPRGEPVPGTHVGNRQSLLQGR